MREILFKGRRIDNGDWVYGYYAKAGNSINVKAIIFEINKSVIQLTEVKPETVSQFTGLLDKNGNNIFEGDILFYNGITSNGKPFKRTVFFDAKKGQFRANMYHLDMSIEYAEIIGNIHEDEK